MVFTGVHAVAWTAIMQYHAAKNIDQRMDAIEAVVNACTSEDDWRCALALISEQVIGTYIKDHAEESAHHPYMKAGVAMMNVPQTAVSICATWDDDDTWGVYITDKGEELIEYAREVWSATGDTCPHAATLDGDDDDTYWPTPY